MAIGVRRKSEVVDHTVPFRGDMKLFWNVSNWQASCEWHHNSIKPQLEREWTRGLIGANDLRLDSERAKELTRSKHRPAIGLDGFAIPGT
jgi:5-methylcytosine-specific restriction protein A